MRKYEKYTKSGILNKLWVNNVFRFIIKKINWDSNNSYNNYDKKIKTIFNGCDIKRFDFKEYSGAKEFKRIYKKFGYIVIDDPITKGSDSIGLIAMKGMRK